MPFSPTILGLAGLLALSCEKHAAERPGEAFDAGPVFSATTSQLTHQFLVKNTTSRTVRILGKVYSCSCTKAEIDQITLRPGEATPLTVVVNTIGAYSRSDVSCIVKTDHPEYPEWVYHLTWQSFPYARLDPERIDLGAFSPTQDSGKDALTREAWLECYAPTTGKLPRADEVDIDGIPQELVVEFDRNPLIETWPQGIQRARFRVRIRLKEEVMMEMPGTQSRGFNFRVGDRLGPSMTVVWTVESPLTAAPSRIHFGMVAPDDPAQTRKVIIRSGSGQPFQLLSVDCDSSALTARVEHPSQSAASHRVELTLSPPTGEKGSFLSGSVQIKTDVAALPVVRVPWSAFLRRSEAGPSPNSGIPAARGAADEEEE